ncbi:ABC transporter permease, partial [Streptomyces sp. SID625]|nr:ABC transporter permease [Streptomyces sp. SID625]
HRTVTSRRRTVATVGRFALPLLLIVVVTSAWTTIDRFHGRPESLGLPAALTVRTDGTLDDRETRDLLRREPRVAAVYPGVQ